MEYQIGSLVFDEWKIIRRIGNGASGVVYEIQKAEHNITLTSALKVMRVPRDASLIASLQNDGLDNQSVTSYLQDVVEELIEEIKIMVSMKGFPYIVSCEDYKVIPHPQKMQWDVLIRMELLTPLQAYQQEQGMAEADVYRLGIQMAKALMLLEKRNIIHRDIKPENIFVNSFGDFKVGDFGIARVYDKVCDNLSKKGTENYMAPEIYCGGDYDNRVDIYSLGLVMYRGLNKNRLPFYPLDVSYKEADRQQALADRLNGQKEMLFPALASPEMGRIILKMCAYYPEDRYQSAQELLQDLEAVNISDKAEILQIRANDCIQMEKAPQDADNSELTDAIFSGRSKSVSCDKKGTHTLSKGKNNIESVQPEEGYKREKFKNEENNVPFRNSKSSERKQMEREKEQQENKGSVPKKENGRKLFIQIAAVAAILLAIVIPLRLSQKYVLTVNGGSGSGSYKSGTSVTVRAQEVKGSSFQGWEAAGLELSEAERSCEEITICMPRKKVSLTAIYEEEKYKVTVNQGSGSGTYKLNDTVWIEADEPKEGYVFDTWEVNSGSPELSDPSAQKTLFKMKEEQVTLTAAYRLLEYELVVDGASGSGVYAYGDKITLEADSIENSSFEKWIVESATLAFTEEELTTARLSFTMPAEEIRISAEYSLNEHVVTVNGGSGSGTYTVGDRVTITADEAAEGSQFISWKVKEGDIGLKDETEEEVSFTMPDDVVEITAQYDLIEYVLAVNNGNGSGAYHLGDKVTISADPMREGMIFSHWTVDKGKLTLADMSVQNISFTMPAEELTLTAHYMIQKYTVKVTNGKGSGMYSAGDEVEIAADLQDTNDNVFDFWSVTSGELDFEELGIDKTKDVIQFKMPEQNIVLQANYTAQKKESSGSYALTVNGGSGSGTYAAGDTVQIMHDEAPTGMIFAYWLLNQEDTDASTYKTDSLTLTMPAKDVTVTAVFEERQ